MRLLADKVREVDEQITARAGLRYEAFIQTVLLPQADATPENFNAARTKFAEANMNHAAALRPTLKQSAGCIRIAVGAAHRQAARRILLVPRGKSRGTSGKISPTRYRFESASVANRPESCPK